MKRPYERFGDIKNSDFFEEYLEKLYNWRDSSGLSERIKEMHSVIVEVDEEDRYEYIKELSMMSPYHFQASHISERFIYSLLETNDKSPGFIIRSRRQKDQSIVFAMNLLSPVARKKPYTRYIGEVYRVEEMDKVIEALEKSGVEFQKDSSFSSDAMSFARTMPSKYSWNTVAYIENENEEKKYFLEKFPSYTEKQVFLEELKEIKTQQKKIGIQKLIQPIDHLATRVFHQDREHAILEYIKLSSYHYWGSYDIADQNSSTNVTRNIHDYPESRSPARVFTAANTPHYVDHIVHLPSPTESFVMNYGKRMHHVAYSIADNEDGSGEDNIDIVVDSLKKEGIDFLLKIIGSEEEGLKQVFSRTSKYSLLITEYVQRYNGFQGFFTKKNVAFLTKAAGADEELQKNTEDKEPRIGECDLCD